MHYKNVVNKNSFFAIFMLLFLFFGSVNGISKEATGNGAVSGYAGEQFAVVAAPFAGCGAETGENLALSVDCTIRVKTDDMDVEITFHDISRWDCVKLKVGSWWNRLF